MKHQILIAVLAACTIACNNNAEKTSTEETKESMATKAAINTAGYTPTYSTSFEMGDTKHAETVLALWRDWDKGDLQPSKMFFADSIRFFTSDGSLITGPRDSAVAGAQNFRNMFLSVKSTLHAVLPVKSTDKNEDWVYVWGTEVTTDKNGKTDSSHLQETWRFNEEGKIDLLYQYSRVAKPQPASK